MGAALTKSTRDPMSSGNSAWVTGDLGLSAVPVVPYSVGTGWKQQEAVWLEVLGARWMALGGVRLPIADQTVEREVGWQELERGADPAGGPRYGASPGSAGSGGAVLGRRSGSPL